MSTGAAVALVTALTAVFVVVVAVVGSKAGRSRGYSGMGGETIVRSSQGHLFTTLWVPGASLKGRQARLRAFPRLPRVPEVADRRAGGRLGADRGRPPGGGPAPRLEAAVTYR